VSKDCPYWWHKDQYCSLCSLLKESEYLGSALFKLREAPLLGGEMAFHKNREYLPDVCSVVFDSIEGIIFSCCSSESEGVASVNVVSVIVHFSRLTLIHMI
jgi:hypothetical protein